MFFGPQIFYKTNCTYRIARSSFFACSSVLARIVLALVNLPLAESPSIARVAVAGEVVDTVHAQSVAARVTGTVVPVLLASRSGESARTIAREAVVRVATGAAVVARVADAVVQVDLAVLATKTSDAGASVAVDSVRADSSILARGKLALINVHLTVNPGITYKYKINYRY